MQSNPLHANPVDSNPSNFNNVESDVTFVDAFSPPAAGRPHHSAILKNRDHLQPGDVLGGRYEISNVLGEGGMGTVYKALDREVDHLVALKLIRSEMAANPAILARFKQELLTAGRSRTGTSFAFTICLKSMA